MIHIVKITITSPQTEEHDYRLFDIDDQIEELQRDLKISLALQEDFPQTREESVFWGWEYVSPYKIYDRKDQLKIEKLFLLLEDSILNQQLQIIKELNDFLEISKAMLQINFKRDFKEYTKKLKTLGERLNFVEIFGENFCKNFPKVNKNEYV